MLDFQRDPRCHPQFEGAVAAATSRKVELDGARLLRQPLADDLGPMLDQLRLAKSSFSQCLAGDSGQHRTDHLQSPAPRFGHRHRD